MALHEDRTVLSQAWWVASVEGQLKLNVDAIIHNSRNKTGYDFVVRDRWGHFVVAQASATPWLKQPAITEGTWFR